MKRALECRQLLALQYGPKQLTHGPAEIQPSPSARLRTTADMQERPVHPGPQRARTSSLRSARTCVRVHLACFPRRL
jgi:hypothetical protein